MIASWTPQLLPPQYRVIAAVVALIVTLAGAGYAGWTVRAWRCDAQTAEIYRQLSKWISEYEMLKRSAMKQNAAISQWKQRAEDVQQSAQEAINAARAQSASRQDEITRLKRKVATGGASCSVAIGEIKGAL